MSFYDRFIAEHGYGENTRTEVAVMLQQLEKLMEKQNKPKTAKGAVAK